MNQLKYNYIMNKETRNLLKFSFAHWAGKHITCMLLMHFHVQYNYMYKRERREGNASYPVMNDKNYLRIRVE